MAAPRAHFGRFAGAAVLMLTASWAGAADRHVVAYRDNDGCELRENFAGSPSVPDGKKHRRWIDANLFGKLILDAAQ